MNENSENEVNVPDGERKGILLMKNDPLVHESGPGLDREAKIREQAYLLWEEAGCPEGDGSEFWVQAEQNVNCSEKS